MGIWGQRKVGEGSTDGPGMYRPEARQSRKEVPETGRELRTEFQRSESILQGYRWQLAQRKQHCGLRKRVRQGDALR